MGVYNFDISPFWKISKSKNIHSHGLVSRGQTAFFRFYLWWRNKRIWSGLHMHLVLTPLKVLNKLRHQHFSRFENMKYGKPVLLSKQFSEVPCVSGGFWCDMLCSRLNFDARR